MSETVTLAGSKTLIYRQAETLVASSIEVEIVEFNFDTNACRIFIPGQSRFLKLYPTARDKTTAVTDAEAIIRTQVAIIAKAALDNGFYV